MQEAWDMWLHDIVGVVCMAWILVSVTYMFVKIWLIEREESERLDEWRYE